MQSFVKFLRECYGITRAEFAKRVGLSGSFVGQIENGKRKQLSKTALKSICDTFFVAEQWLLTGKLNETYHMEIEKIGVKPSYVAERLEKPVEFIEAIFDRKISPNEDFFAKIVETSNYIKTHGGDNSEIYKKVRDLENSGDPKYAPPGKDGLSYIYRNKAAEYEYDKVVNERDDAYKEIIALQAQVKVLTQIVDSAMNRTNNQK